MGLAPQTRPPADDGWETVTDPADVPADIRKSLGVAGVRTALGLGSGTGSSGKALPEWAEKKYQPQLDTYAGLSSSLSGFKDDYGGNSVTGDAENWIQGKWSGFGTPGQRDWWAQFRTNDNQIRNKLFGSALTDSEKKAYESTTIEPSMDPKEIRRNLESRKAIVQKALQRTTKFLQAQGYSHDAIAALAGEYAPELGAVPPEQTEEPTAEPAKGGDRKSGDGGAPAAATDNGTPPITPKAPPGTDVVFGDEELGSHAKEDEAYRLEIENAINSGADVAALNAIADKFGQAHWDGNETLKKAFELRDKGQKVSVGAVPRKKIDISADRGKSAVGDTIKAFARGIPATVGLDDELLAASDAILNGQDYGEALDYNRAIRDHDEQNNFWARLAGSAATAAFIPSGAINAGRSAALTAARTGIGREAALAAGRAATTRQAAMESAALGGAYGFGATDGDLGDRILGGAGGAGLGAITGGALANVGSRLAQGGTRARPLTEGQEVLAAMDRQDITPFAADVGGPMTRLATAGTSQTLAGVGPVRRAAQATIDSAQAVRDRVASSFGIVANPEQAGETARLGARAFMARTSARGNGLYTAAERAAGQARVETPGAIRILDEEIARLAETPGGTEGLERLQGLRDALGEPNTVRGLRNMRTALRDQFETAGLRNSNLERIANRVVDAASDDIVGGLQQQGLEQAARAYRLADRYWRNRLATIDDAIEPILGNANNPKSGEQIVQALKQSMAGNNRRFGRFIESLPPQERGTVRASLISGLGRATKGNQDETGEVFSLGTFLTHWNEIGASAKNTLFGDEARAALNDLAIVARGAKQSQRFANTSNTGAAVTTSALGGVALTGPGMLFAAKILAGQYAAGRLLASPRFARWIARMPANPNRTQGRAYIGRLSRIARSEPAIANEVLDLQRRLVDAFSQTPTRAAASQEEQQ